MKKLGIKGETLIKGFEELRLKGYICPAGKPTIGWGHVILPGEPYRVGGTISLDEAIRLLDRDTNRFELCVNKTVKAPLTQNQFDALTSLAFNIGEAKFKESSLLRALNNGQMDVAAAKFMQWVFAGKRKLKGLVRRRAAEKALFESE